MRGLTRFCLFSLVIATHPALAAALEMHRYDADGQTYTYSVKPTGENYLFGNIEADGGNGHGLLRVAEGESPNVAR